MDMTNLGAYLRERRRALGMTQLDLADAVGATQSAISEVERGRILLPSADLRRRLAAALGVRHIDLLIAAGELTPDEAGGALPAHDPAVAEICAALTTIPVSAAFRRYLLALIESERKEAQAAPQPVGASRS